jgi:hypothetical protein
MEEVNMETVQPKPSNLTSDPTRGYFDTKSIARETGLSTGYFENLRVYGGGPRFLKVGRRVLYSWEDVQNWLDKRFRANTSDSGKTS